jgi:predicted AlkP superfamily pyrophosphatase or phosphodiesterase
MPGNGNSGNGEQFYKQLSKNGLSYLEMISMLPTR